MSGIWSSLIAAKWTLIGILTLCGAVVDAFGEGQVAGAVHGVHAPSYDGLSQKPKKSQTKSIRKLIDR